MRIPITVPNLRTGTEPLRISGWLADEGDLIVAGDIVVEILIPGVTLDIIAEFSGRLVEITKPVDASISVGDVVGWIDDATTDSAEDDSSEVS